MDKKQIPHFKGADRGILGVETPVGIGQQGDIADRLKAAGVDRALSPVFEELQRNTEAEASSDAAATPVDHHRFPRRADGYEAAIVRGLHRK